LKKVFKIPRDLFHERALLFLNDLVKLRIKYYTIAFLSIFR
jgi:hypothetical protein